MTVILSVLIMCVCVGSSRAVLCVPDAAVRLQCGEKQKPLQKVMMSHSGPAVTLTLTLHPFMLPLGSQKWERRHLPPTCVRWSYKATTY